MSGGYNRALTPFGFQHKRSRTEGQTPSKFVRNAPLLTIFRSEKFMNQEAIEALDLGAGSLLRIEGQE